MIHIKTKEGVSKAPSVKIILKRGFTENPFLQENLYYNEKDNYFVCPTGQHMVYSGGRDKAGSNGYAGKLSLYKACNCQRCPLRGECHNAERERE